MPVVDEATHSDENQVKIRNEITLANTGLVEILTFFLFCFFLFRLMTAQSCSTADCRKDCIIFLLPFAQLYAICFVSSKYNFMWSFFIICHL